MDKQKCCVATPPYLPHRLSLKPPTPTADTPDTEAGEKRASNQPTGTDWDPQGPGMPPKRASKPPTGPQRDPNGTRRDPQGNPQGPKWDPKGP